MSARRTLLVVLEPEDGGDELGAGEDRAAGQTAAEARDVRVSEATILVSETTRLANELAVDARFVTWAGLSDLPPGAVAAALAGVAERLRPAAVLLADTDLGRELAPMVAQRLGSGAVVGCSDVLCLDCGQEKNRGEAWDRSPRLTFVKPVYGGWLEQEIEAAEGCIPVVTLDLTGMSVYEPLPESPPPPEVLPVKPGSVAAVRSLEVIPPDPGTVDLVHAKRVVAAGSGTTGEGLLSAAQELAELLEGSVGATRPVVDDGEAPKERLIGQTGRTVTPDLYLALGISGSPHHIAGVKEAGRFLSINRDARAPIFQFSDTGYVGDLEVVLPALVEKLKEYRDGVDSAG